MKVHFMFRGHRYLAPSKREAWAFVKFWNEGNPNIFPIKTTWKIKHVERGPGWEPYKIDFGHKNEYA